MIQPEISDIINIDEDVVYYNRLPGTTAFYKDGKRIIRKCIIVTKSYLIFLDYQKKFFFMPMFCRDVNIIRISHITMVLCTRKLIFGANKPYIEIATTHDEIYGFSPTATNRCTGELKSLVDTIKNLNICVEIIDDLPDIKNQESKSIAPKKYVFYGVLLFLLSALYIFYFYRAVKTIPTLFYQLNVP